LPILVAVLGESFAVVPRRAQQGNEAAFSLPHAADAADRIAAGVSVQAGAAFSAA
jgi:hypothetical protein